MIADLRIYTCKPNKLAEWVAMYKNCWPLQQKYLGRCLGWFTTVEGELNTVVHIWVTQTRATASAGATRWPPIRNGRSSSPRATAANCF